MSKKAGTKLDSALHDQYKNRSLFIHRSLKLAGLQHLVDEVLQLDDNQYSWDLIAHGLAPDAVEILARRGIQKSRVFCHPTIIQEAPHLVRYYRNITGLTQKALVKLAVAVKGFETGVKATMGDEQAAKIARVINTTMSSIIVNDDSFDQRHLLNNLVASFGITLDGSWRNQIGKKAADEVKELFRTYLGGRKLILKEIKSRLILKREIVVHFGSDPDVAIYGVDGKLIVSIEVKGGIDSAGALERYGAARKSFDKSRKANVRCHTIYLASCITQAVHDRIEEDGLVSQIEDLLEIMANPMKARSFFEDLFNHVIRI